MNCTEYQKLINVYIEGELANEELDDFVTHVCACDECIDELIVNYSVITALDQLDKGDDLSEDYEGDLRAMLKEHLVKKRKRRIFYVASAVVMFICSVIIGIAMSIALFNDDNIKYGESDSIVIKYNGVPIKYDPVDDAVNSYNAEVIHYLHGRNSNE